MKLNLKKIAKEIKMAYGVSDREEVASIAAMYVRKAA